MMIYQAGDRVLVKLVSGKVVPGTVHGFMSENSITPASAVMICLDNEEQAVLEDYLFNFENVVGFIRDSEKFHA